MYRKKSNLVPGLKSHDLILEEVVNRLYDKNKYSNIEKQVPYMISVNDKTYYGEVDVLCYREETDSWVFYEIKSNSFGSKRKAKSQYQKFLKTHPEINVTGYMVYPDTKLGLDYLRIKKL